MVYLMQESRNQDWYNCQLAHLSIRDFFQFNSTTDPRVWSCFTRLSVYMVSFKFDWLIIEEMRLVSRINDLRELNEIEFDFGSKKWMGKGMAELATGLTWCAHHFLFCWCVFRANNDKRKVLLYWKVNSLLKFHFPCFLPKLNFPWGWMSGLILHTRSRQMP